MLSPEQIEMRKNSLGGTDAATIMGHGFQTPYQLWLEKLGLVEDNVDNEYAEWGSRHEETIAKKVQENHPDLHFVFPNKTYKHPDYNWLHGTPDGLIDDDGIWECKTTSEYRKDKYGDEDTDQIPEAYIIQVQHYFFVTGRKYAIVSVLIGGNKYREYRVERNDDLINKIFEKCKSFWFDNVKAEVEPPVVGDDQDALKKQYPEEQSNFMPVTTPEIDALAEKIKEAQEHKKTWEAAEKDLKAQFMLLLKEHEGVEGVWGKATWKKAKSGYVAWKDIAKEFDPPEELIQKHTGEGTRSLRFYFKKG